MSLKNYRHSVCDTVEKSIFLNRELTTVRKKVYEVIYNKLKGRQMVPINYDLHPGAESDAYQVMDTYGNAKVGGSYSTNAPRVGAGMKEVLAPLKPIRNAYGFSIQEIRAAAMAQKPLSSILGVAARRVMERTLDGLLLDGSTTEGLAGLFSMSGATTGTLASGAVGTTWADKTSDEKIVDLNNPFNQIANDSSEALAANTLIIPLTAMQDISLTRMRDSSDTTILQHFKSLNPDVTVLSHVKLETAGAGSTRRMLAYDNSEDMLHAVIPQEFEQLRPQEIGYETIINCHMRYGGIRLLQPKSACYLDAF